MKDRKRVHAIVSGLVQGVCYRASTRDAAKQIGGLTGWVRNLPDGTVELEAEGPAEKVDALIKWCHEGSPWSRVRDVSVEEQTPVGVDGDFVIRY